MLTIPLFCRLAYVSALAGAPGVLSSIPASATILIFYWRLWSEPCGAAFVSTIIRIRPESVYVDPFLLRQPKSPAKVCQWRGCGTLPCRISIMSIRSGYFVVAMIILGNDGVCSRFWCICVELCIARIAGDGVRDTNPPVGITESKCFLGSNSVATA
jgi:hypothetical protein